ncbi:MAG: leucine-rich repeat protein [Clostridia bacterium]|nr:leucine-rich repeat protein [Clostridia bacterium]
MKFFKKLTVIMLCLMLLIMPGCSLFFPSNDGDGDGGEGDGGGNNPPQDVYYNVSFYNDDNTFLWTGKFKEFTYISELEYGGPEFSKAPTATETYEFMCWRGQYTHDVRVTSDMSVYAYYSSKTRHYDVTYKNYDGTILEATKTQYGEENVYSGFKPERKSDNKLYKFTGWDNTDNVITQNTEFVAQYSETDLYGINISKEQYSDYAGDDHPDTASSVLFSSEEDNFRFSNNNVISYFIEGEYLRFYYGNDICNSTKIKGIENVSFEGIKGSIAVSFGWLNEKGEVEYLVTEIADEQTPVVWAPYPATHVSMKVNLAVNKTASASSATIHYSGVEPEYNPTEYTEDLSFSLLSDGTYEASLHRIPVKEGYTLSDAENVVIPAFYKGKPVTQVGELTGKFKTVYIPDNVKRFTWTSIDSDNLVEIRIPNTIEEILYSSFNFNFYNYINNATNVSIYNGYYYVGNEDNPYLVVLGHYSNYIGYFHIASSCRVVAQKAFYRQYEGNSLEKVEIPSSVISIGDGGFYEMDYISIPEDSQLKYIGASAFYEAQIYDFVMPKNIEVISNNAFYNVDVENITFSEDSKLRVIENMAFNRIGVESIDLPMGLEEIGDSAFEDTPLKSIKIPSTVTTIGDGILCDNYYLEEIVIKGESSKFEVIDGNLYTKGGAKLLAYTNVNKDSVYEIPSFVTEIPESTFYDETTIKTLYIGENVTKIGEYAFYKTYMTIYYAGETKPAGWLDNLGTTALYLGVTKDEVITQNGMQFIIENNRATLTRFITPPANGGDVVIPSTITVEGVEYLVETIGKYAFYHVFYQDCGTLTIPNTVKYIKECCFYGAGFTSINIPESVEVIELDAYAYTEQANIYLPKTIKSFTGSFGPNWDTPTVFYYNGTVADWVANVEETNIRYEDLYFKYGDNYVHKDDIEEIVATNKDTFSTSIFTCFQGRDSVLKVYVGKEVTAFEGTWDFWQNDGVNVHIYYEGTEEEFNKIKGENIENGTLFNIYYNVDFTNIRNS